MRYRRWVVSLWVAVLCSACGDETVSTPLQQQMYVWRRVWTPAVTAAMERANSYVSGWRILVAEADVRGAWKEFSPVAAMSEVTPKSLIAVIRIEGQRGLPDSEKLAARLVTWVHAQPTGQWSTLEIDYDCPTRELRGYISLLRSLRQALPPGMHLSLTALPAWISSSDLPTLLSVADESVLQVHSVLDPHRGLFVGTVAMRWAASYSRVNDKPFSVALPDYGSRIAWDEAGHLLSVLSEEPGTQSGSVQKELEADPRDVAAFLEQLRIKHARNLTGIVWFRLPVEGDRRIWSLSSLESVIRGRPLISQRAVTTERDNFGAYRVMVSNVGTVDIPLPRTVRMNSCVQADGLTGYVVRHGSDNLTFVAGRSSMLRVGQHVVIGWTRCGVRQEDLSLED
jgi:hypothetical protein